MVQQCTDTIPKDYTDKTYYNTDGLIPIQTYIHQLQQQLVEQDWNRDYRNSEMTQRELLHVLDYQEKTGSMYYPMF